MGAPCREGTQAPLQAPLLLLLLLCGASAARTRIPLPPPNALLHAPMTPFTASGSLNLSAVPALAADAAASGVNFVFVVGGMGQYDALTLAERKAIAGAWVAAAHPLDIYVCVHVGALALADAVELAQHAASIGADAVASVPPFYEKPVSAAVLAAWLAPVAAAAPELAFFYYHIPAATGVDVSMVSFFPVAIATIPTFCGVKFVSTDLVDYGQLVETYSQVDPPLSLLFAPEPKLAGVALGAQGVVLAESFFARSWLRMCNFVKAGSWDLARAEQSAKMRIISIFAGFAGFDAERTVYRRLIGLDMGPPRLPLLPLSNADSLVLFAQLNAAGFFSTFQGDTPPPCLLT